MFIPTTTTPGKQMNSVQMFTNTIPTTNEHGSSKKYQRALIEGVMLDCWFMLAEMQAFIGAVKFKLLLTDTRKTWVLQG